MEEAPFEADLSELSYHGGNLGAARRLYPRAPEPWIDLSTGVNPHAYPLPPLLLLLLPHAAATKEQNTEMKRRDQTRIRENL